MNKDNIKKTIRLAFWDTVEDHPAAVIGSFIVIGTFLVTLILASPVLTVLAVILTILLPPIILIVSFIRNYQRYKEHNF